MTTALGASRRAPSAQVMLNKVPEITVYFWVIKILCTTVGESFADYVNETLGVGLTNTTLLFSAALVVAMVAQFRLRRYVPGIYWLVVVLVSVVGTLLTDNLTDGHGVPLWFSTTLFTVLLCVVFGVWYARERTLSIHTIVTRPRESFYWLTVLVTFALGTAAGDWTLDLTGWGPGPSVLLPAGLIAAVLLFWRFGADAVLSFWVAFILTRPLGANIGDFLGSPRDEGGQGLGTLWTSVLFLAAILATVVFLTLTRKDRTEIVYATGDEHPGVGLDQRRLLVISEQADVSDALVTALRERALAGPLHVHLVVTNPDAHEMSLRHPEQHRVDPDLELALVQAVDQLTSRTNAEVSGSVSIRHDPMDAVESALQHEAVDEILVAASHHPLAEALHQGLTERLGHLRLPIGAVAGAERPRRG